MLGAFNYFLILKRGKAQLQVCFELVEEIIVPCPIQMVFAEASHWQAAAIIINSYEML